MLQCWNRREYTLQLSCFGVQSALVLEHSTGEISRKSASFLRTVITSADIFRPKNVRKIGGVHPPFVSVVCKWCQSRLWQGREGSSNDRNRLIEKPWESIVRTWGPYRDSIQISVGSRYSMRTRLLRNTLDHFFNGSAVYVALKKLELA